MSNKTFVLLLKYATNTLGMSDAELADAIRVSKSSVERWKYEERNLPAGPMRDAISLFLLAKLMEKK